MTRQRDSQRSAVYAWERAVIAEAAKRGASNPELPLDDCRLLVDSVWRQYLPTGQPPKVVDGRGTRVAFANWRRINLPRWARTAPIVLHELAHAILDADGCVEAWHGKRFARFLAQLLHRHADVADLTEGQIVRMGVHQKPRRVRFASPKDTPQRISRAGRGKLSELARLRGRRQRIDAQIDKLTGELRNQRLEITDQIRRLRAEISEEHQNRAARVK